MCLRCWRGALQLLCMLEPVEGVRYMLELPKLMRLCAIGAGGHALYAVSAGGVLCVLEAVKDVRVCVVGDGGCSLCARGRGERALCAGYKLAGTVMIKTF